MNTHFIRLLAVLCLAATALQAQVPQLINYQGRVAVDGLNFDGTGQFKFAFVSAAGTTTYWSNDGTSTAGSEPTAAVALTVTKGLYSVLLGDATLPGMTIVPATVFTNGDVHLRAWFNDGTHGFQLLTPDKRIAAVGYAMIADSVVDGAITAAKVADSAITTSKIADGAVTSAKLAPGVVQTSNLAAGAVGNAQLANPALTITAGTGLSGGGVVALGDTLTLSNAGVLSLNSGGGIMVDAATGNVTLGSTATSANTASAIVARDASGNFSAGTVSAALNGNATTATSTPSFTGTLAGDVTGTQGATAIAASTITGKAITGFASSAGTLTGTDTLLSAINKLDGNTALKAPLASPTFTGTVTGSFVGPLTGDVTGNVSGSAASFTGSLVGDVTGTQSATAIAATTITGKAITGFTSSVGTVAATDSLLTAINKLDGNTALKAPLASPTFTGSVTLPAGTATLAPILLQTGISLTTPSFGAVEFDGTNVFVTTNSATPTRKTLAFTDSTVTSAQLADNSVTTAKLASAAVGSAQLTSGLTLGGTTTGSFSGDLMGNVTGNATTSTSFTGSLVGDVTGTQASTVVASVGGLTAATVAAGATVANAATDANTASTLVKRDTSGNFSAGTITATLNGNASTATHFTGSLAGDVTGTQGATAIAASTITGKAITGFASSAGALADTDSLLIAINKLDGNTALKAPLASPTFSGTVSGSFSGPLTGNVTGNVSGSAGNFTGALAGDVTGTQGNTSVTMIAGTPAADVASGASLANAATTVSTPNTLVKRDASGNIPGVTPASTPPGMTLIPAGAFMMGNSVVTDVDITDANPISASISAFYIDMTEVTLGQWQTVYQWATLVGGYAFSHSGAGKAINHPVQMVDWYDCLKWCNARSEREGKTPVYYTNNEQTTVYRTGNVNVTNDQVKWAADGYRLPTEAEWEKAARGGLIGKRFPLGDTISQKQASYYGVTASYLYDLGPNGHNAIGSLGGTSPATSPVGSFAANGSGLYDITGNVFEWCWDWYGTPYDGGTDPHGPDSGADRVLRGGSWNSDRGANYGRCANRAYGPPSAAYDGIGLRAVQSQTQP